MSDKLAEFPTGGRFLELTQTTADVCAKETDDFCISAGKKLPQTIEALGTVLSMLYRLSSCYFGCPGGDHQVQWLIGKICNQSVAAYTLIRVGQYDEALMLTRGIGEITNLVWLFNEDKQELADWKLADKKTRTRLFSPSAVRRRLKKLPIGMDPPIDDLRYAALCEIGTHPTPGLPPGHYTGTGRGIIGGLMQEVGVFVAVNELAYAVAMSVPVCRLLKATKEVRVELRDRCADLLGVVGGVSVLNYEEGLRELHQHASEEVSGTRRHPPPPR